MGCENFIATLTLIAVTVAAMPNQRDPPCDFTGFNPSAAVSRVLAEMPTHTEHGHHEFETIFPGFEVGGLNVSGLHHIEQYGPAIPFCVNGSRLLQVDLIHNDNVALSMPWRSCSGREGIIRLGTELSRFTVQFQVVDSNLGDASALSFVQSLIPVTVEGVYATIEGAGEAFKTVTEVFSKVFDGIIRETWNQAFSSSFYDALQKAVEESLQVRSNQITPL